MEFDGLKNPHPHPLIFYQLGKPDGDPQNQNVCCSKCRQPWRPPAFGCSDCNFHLHQSCIDLPPQIHTRFHPHHRLSLTYSNNSCNCCRQKPYGNVYCCRECDFQIDVQCAIADTKSGGLRRTAGGEFRHFAHPHPLTLQWVNSKVVCLVCQLLIKPGSTYFCSHCDSHFHQQCAELPREILYLDYHDHPLFLFARPFVYNTLCDCCRNECIEFFYGCPLCNFNLHVACLLSFKHEHDFVNLRKLLPYECQLCGKSERGFPWYCSICHLFAHRKCAEVPSIVQTSKHHHPLAPTSLDDSNIGPLVNQENGVPHFSHKHTLTLCPGEDRHCDGCMCCISTQSYGCSECGFYLHEECARLPRHKNFFLHPHLLSMVYIPDFVFSCAVCLRYCHGFTYHCEECLYTIDIRCAAIAIPFAHSSHEHPLYLYRTNGEKPKCEACGEGMENKVAFRCVDCNFYLDARCATLPLALRYRFDEHPLNLTFVKEDEEGDDHYCDVCEEERDADQWFYYCRVCSFAAHLSCVLGEYPFLKSAKCETHRHPLCLVTEGKNGYSACGACGDSCDGNLAFECGRCKFNVHAFGHCCHRQRMQGRITFTMPSIYSRSLVLFYLHPMKTKGRIYISLGQYGGRDGKPWNERVFSTIKRFVVNHARWIDSIRIEYEKNGKSFRSAKHGGNGGSRSEVVLDYPDEYLVTIDGNYNEVLLDGIAITVIGSLTLRSNRKSYGPFGKLKGTEFSFPTDGMEIVGIHGRSDRYLHSIGLHAVSILS